MLCSRHWLLALLLALAGCAHRAPEAEAPAPVSPATWRQVNNELLDASRRATAQAEVYAQGSMEHWRTRVYQQTDEQFIPWFSGYWTQEWLSLKVGWYSLNDRGDAGQSSRRLAAYLQEQYQERVLAPVAREIDADAITGEAMEFYVQLLRQQLAQISSRYPLPASQLDQHLGQVLAIDLGPAAEQRASLTQLVRVEPIARLPAYGPLLQRIRGAPATEQGAPAPGVSQVAQVTSDKLQAQFAARGVAGAVAAAVGRVAGALISVGVAGVRALVQDHDREGLQAQTRRDLGAAFDQAWSRQLHDPEHGIMAGVYYLGRQIESQLQAPVAGEDPAGSGSP
ncbi:hypothetical protein [Pseudomonas sp. Au-Pse12]|uniref:hypothetical protein n=1 Tax=Pseudomonas sp. Au-Pse12 TaxID=2906459 RepID=UPI001E3BD913|nr:hypothetical protein [Pseudomonas sp. Au-Pse12]MCE4056823.1 hypothetical protein [Pseudomonas sp. Au-Pse12]